ncbi:MAG TPA: ABC-F family ATP-binding cassette domain-containing protein [Ktedonobacterales bacterium]
MSLVVVSDLTKSYGAELIFSRVSFRIEAHDRVGLVGPNGAGKSTLLKLLAGQLTVDDGDISFERGVAVGYLPQTADFHPEHTLYDEMLTVFAQVHAWHAEMDELAARLGDPALLEQPEDYASVLERYGDLQARIEHAGGYTTEQRVRQVLDGLGFSREQQAAPATHLSGGQQTRAALGKLLLQEPDLLLLDEPTNHLDLAALEWLEGYLTSWRGAVIVVSHDRYFLDRVTTKTIEIAHHRGEEYPGNYTKYVELREERLARWRKEYESQQEYIARTEEFVRRYKAGQRSKEARGRQTLLDRMERIERPPSERDLKFKLGVNVESGNTALTTDRLVVGYSGEAADGQRAGAALRVAVADTEILRGDRVGLLGPNGGGKTTLLRTIIGQLKPLEGRLTLGHNVQLGYYAQTHDELNPRLTVLDEIRQQTHLSEEGARSYLGRFLFSGDDVFKPISALSGGERSRVALAKLTLQGANFLVLDEPTNHLDLPARQALEAILSRYDGTLIFVSHDRYFMDALATKLWVLEEGVITAHVGNYTTYRARQAQASFVAQAQIARESAAARAAATREGAAGKRDEAPSGRRGLDAIENDIVRGEERLAQIERDLAEASDQADVDRIVTLGEDYEREKAHIEALYTEWQGMAS